MKSILQEAYNYAISYADSGELANYIPELANEDKYRAAGAIIDKDGTLYEVGDSDYKFTAQSIIKVIIYLCTLENYDFEYIKQYVGVKASSKPFNSIIELELSNKRIPVNPFINAGAIVATSLIYDIYGEETFDVILNRAKVLMDDDTLDYSESIFNSERSCAYNNRALAYMLLGHGIISADIDINKLLDCYFKACSILVNVKHLAKLSFKISRGGKSLDGKEEFSSEHARILRTLMSSCGTYDYSGDFAIRIGIPAKSGVGGGIVTASKASYGIASYCPGLDSHGNSYVGTRILEYISKELDLNIY